MDAKVRTLGKKAWTSAAAIGSAAWQKARVAGSLAQKRAARYTPAAIIKRRHRARQWSFVMDAATLAAAYGARAAVRRFLPAAHKGRGPSKA